MTETVLAVLGPGGPELADPAAPLLRIIAVYTGIQAVSLMIVSVLQAAGHARRAAMLNIAGGVLFAFALATTAYLLRRPEAVAMVAVGVS